VPLRTLAQNDDLLNLRDLPHEAEGEAAERMQQIARAAYAHTESNLCAISPEKSHYRKSLRRASGILDAKTASANEGRCQKEWKEQADAVTLEK
jgi:hypothetical protein